MALEGYNEAKWEDKKGINHVHAEVNFTGDPELKKYVRLSIGGRVAVVDMKDIYTFLLLVADEEIQSDLMPVRRQTVRHLTKNHAVLLKKNMLAGEIVKVKCTFDIPVEVHDGLSGLMDRQKRASPILLPK